MRNSRLSILLVCILYLPPTLMAQDKVEPLAGFGIEAHLLAGKVFKHEKKFTLPIPDVTTGVDVNLVWHTYGKKEWEQRRHYPRIGLAITGINYGIDSVYGQVFGLYPNITVPIISGKAVEWTLRLGNGVGYVTKKFGRVNPDNSTNVAIGSHINDFIMINTDLSYHVNKHWDVKAGAFITHISNGSVRKPNLGVNVAGAGVSASYFPVTSRPDRVVRALQPLSKRYLVQLRYGMSLVSSNTSGGPLLPVYIGTGYVSKRWNDNNKAIVGLDYSYHANLYAHMRNNRLEVGAEKRHAYKSAVVVGNEFMFGRLGIMVQAGIYLRRGYLNHNDVYEKVSANYYLAQKERGPIKEFFIFTALKAHLNVAEMGEMGIGIGF